MQNKILFNCLFLALYAALCVAGPPMIDRPCHMRDYKCIQDNLVANSKCKPNVRGFIPSEYTIPEFRFETPYFNSSYVDHNLIVRNHDSCIVSEFYFNLKRDLAVLGLECFNVNFESDRTLIKHRSLLEDVNFYYHINGTYPILRLTVTMNNANRINFCDEFTYTDIPMLPIFQIDPKDRPTSQFLTRDLSELHIFERETFVSRGQQLMAFFMESMLCNFGCN